MGQARSNKVDVVQLTILTMVNMMGSDIVMLPTKLAEVGTISVISWLVTVVGSMALAWAFAKYGVFSRKSGGMGGYAEYVFGKSGNFMANYTYGASLLIVSVTIAISAVGHDTKLLGASLSPIQIGPATIRVLWICTVANFGGTYVTGQVSSITVWGVIIPVVGLCIIGWSWFSPMLYVDSQNPHHAPFFNAVGSSVAMMLWALLGLESACASTDVMENPERNVPIAVLGGTLGVAVIYIVSTSVIAEIVPNMELASPTAPFGLAFAQMFTPEVGKVIMMLMVIPCCGSLLDWQFTIARVFKSSSNEGYFPKILSRVTKVNAPVQGTLTVVTIQSGLAPTTISPSLNNQLNVLVNLAMTTNIIPHILSMAILVIIQKVASVPLSKAKIVNSVASVGAICSFYALCSSGGEAMLYGSVVTFLGWALYGLVSPCFELKSKHGQKSKVKEGGLATALFLLSVFTRFSELR